MGLSNYSKTPVSNQDPVPNGAPEGWLGGNVNDVLRQIMADVRADIYEQHDWVSFLKDVSPRGAKTVQAGAGANELTILACDARTYLKAGQVIRLLSGAVEVARLMLVSDATFSAGNTTVLCESNRPAGPFDADGLEIFVRRQNVLPKFYWMGMGNTAARDASLYGPTPPDLALWVNTDNAANPMVQLGKGGAWVNVCPINAFIGAGILDLHATGASARFRGYAGTGEFGTFQVTASGITIGGTDMGILELRDDGKLYWNGLNLVPGELDALTLGGQTLAQVQATAALDENLSILPADVTFPGGSSAGEKFIAGLSDLHVPGGAGNGVRRIEFHCKLRANPLNGGTFDFFTLRVRAGTTGTAADAVVYTTNAGGSGIGNVGEIALADILLQVPNLATRISVTVEAININNPAFFSYKVEGDNGGDVLLNPFTVTSSYVWMREIGTTP